MTFSVRTWPCIILAAALLTAPRVARSDDESKAKSQFARGWKELQSGNYSSALVHYERSLAIVPRPRTLYNIAVCEEKLDRPEAAIEHYEKFIEIAETRDSDTVKLARTSIATLTRKLSAPVRIDSRPRNARVYIDGAPEPAGTTPVTLNLMRGNRHLTVRLEEHAPLTRTIRVRKGRRSTQLFKFLEARVIIEVTPADATIRREGDPKTHRGTYRATVRPGTYDFHVSRKGFQDEQFEVKVDGNYHRNIELRRVPPQSATLVVTSRVNGASVSVDGLVVGTTRIDLKTTDAAPSLSRALKPGAHSVLIEHDGTSLGSRLDVRAGETIEIRAGFGGDSVVRSRGFIWTLVGVGATAVASGAVIGVLGLRDVANPQQALHDRGKSRALASDILVVTGSAALVSAWMLNRTTPPKLEIMRHPR